MDWLVGVPLLALQGATALLMLPGVLELLGTLLQRRIVPVEALDLGFSAVLLQQGLPREALMDLALDDGSKILQEVSHHELSRADYRNLISRLAEQETVRTAPDGMEQPIGELHQGARIQLQSGDPLFVPCRIIQGELVAIGLDFDEAGMLTNKLCDLSLSRDPPWLQRLVVLSRSLQHTADGNAVMIGLTHLLSSVATAGLAITPLQTVLLADIPLLLAELRNINSFRSHTRQASS